MTADLPADPASETWTALQLAERIAELADEKQGDRIVILHVGPALAVTDYFVIAGGQNRRHIAALAENVAKELKKDGLYRMGGSALNEDDWVLLDYGAVVFHAFSEEARGYYDLENHWGDCERIDWAPGAPDGSA